MLEHLLHVCDHPGSYPLGLHKLLRFERPGYAQGDSDISSQLALQVRCLQHLHVAGRCLAAKGIDVCNAGCV